MPRFYYHLYYWYWDALKEFDRVILDDMIEVQILAFWLVLDVPYIF